jgi:hypothetical protein
MKMKMWFSQGVSGLTLALVCAAMITPVPVSAQDAHSKKNRRCSDATIAGTYGIQVSGIRPSAPGGPLESIIGVVIRHYDGNGEFTQIDNVKGSISGIVPDRPGFGTYQVNEDCSAVVQLQPGPGILLEERLVIVDDGNGMFSMTSLPPPVMVTAIHTRIHAR